MANLGRSYKITVIATADRQPVNVKNTSGGYFEQLQTVTEFTVNPDDGNGHQIEFDVKRDLRGSPNTCDLVLTNLADEARQSFIGAPVKVVLEAGYTDDLRLLFTGDVRYASNEHEGTEWRTKLQLADGGRAFANAKINRSYAKGTPIGTIVRDLAKAFGVPINSLASVDNDLKTRISSGDVLQGPVSDELTRVLAPFDLEWSFQHGVLQVIKSDGVKPGTIRVISEESGMIGAPEMTPPKIIAAPKHVGRSTGRAKPRVPKLKLKHELYPEVSPGEKIQVISRSMNGLFRVDVVKHKGDFFGNDWITEIEASNTSGGTIGDK